MGFQFQSVAALGPVLSTDSSITHTELGALIGIYLLPGVLFAIPGGWLGKRFGDKRVVLTGLAMMTLGGAIFAFSKPYEIMLLGRFISGLGAVLLNVLITKMVADWFVEHRIEMAMGVLISSWPLGIAIALVTMEPLGQLVGPQWAFMFPVSICAIAFLMVFVVYTSPPGMAKTVQGSYKESRTKLTRYEFRGVVLSGSIWCLYNVAFILPLSFGADYLITKGVALASAGRVVSLASWLIIPALPLGALIAERIGRPVLTMVVSFTIIAILIWMVPLLPYYSAIFALLGFVFGLAGGLIMALPTQVLSKQNRAIGMGVFFTIYYAGMGVLPAVAGYALDITGNPAAPFILAGAAILFAVLLLAVFRFNEVRELNYTAAAPLPRR